MMRTPPRRYGGMLKNFLIQGRSSNLRKRAERAEEAFLLAKEMYEMERHLNLPARELDEENEKLRAEVKQLRERLALHQEPVAWLRDAHNGIGDECLVPALAGDPGAFAVYAAPVASPLAVEATGELKQHVFLGARSSDIRRAITVINAALSGSRPTHRHKKRGSEYVLLGIGRMQAGNWWERNPNQGQATFGQFDQIIDMRQVAIYRSVHDGSLWVRPREEFEDGRFELIVAAPTTGETK